MPTIRTWVLSGIAALAALFPLGTFAQSFSDVTNATFEKDAIANVVGKGWLISLTPTAFGYGKPITQDEWLRLLMFLRTADACPELGLAPNAYWSMDNIQNCLAGVGVPISKENSAQIRRDVAMQQLFALRQRSFAFQQLQTAPADFTEPKDAATIPTNRKGAMIAAQRLKLLFTTQGNILPAAPLLREDAALAVTRFMDWERQGGVDGETHDVTSLSKESQLDHWRDLDTDIYVIQVKSGGDTEIKPILPPRSFNPATSTTATVRDEFIYEPVSKLAKNSGALAAVNGSYFNVQWPWGALEDVAIVDGKILLSRTDRSTFIVCNNGNMYVRTYDLQKLNDEKCVPQQALGAGPLFLSAGNILTTSTPEGFDEYTEWERRVGANARTAIAVSADHKTAYIIIVAGKSYPAFGKGGNTLGTFLKSKYPAISDAMMYDGGGSSTLFANNKTLVAGGISGGQTERAVISAIGVFSKKTQAAQAKQFKKDQAIYWDASTVEVKTAVPAKAFAWTSAKQAKANGSAISLASSRGSSVKLIDTEDNVQVFNFTFDLIATDATSSLTIARREGVHEKGWHIPTEIHVLNPKDKSDTDIIKLLNYIPAGQKPDLKTFDAVAFGKTGIIFGDGSGKYWYYYAKTKQLSPAKFVPPTAKAKTTIPAKKK